MAPPIDPAMGAINELTPDFAGAATTAVDEGEGTSAGILGGGDRGGGGGEETIDMLPAISVVGEEPKDVVRLPTDAVMFIMRTRMLLKRAD